MKDLIAKLQMDANCALGAIWMHIDAQAARIAELEAQIAARADTGKLREIADFIESGIQYNQDAPDMMPEPASKWDYEAGLLVYELRSTALQAPVREVPEGMMLVPKTPTMEMRRAGNDALYKIHQDVTRTLADRAFYCYDAMLAAAPLPADPVQEPKP